MLVPLLAGCARCTYTNGAVAYVLTHEFAAAMNLALGLPPRFVKLPPGFRFERWGLAFRLPFGLIEPGVIVGFARVA